MYFVRSIILLTIYIYLYMTLEKKAAHAAFFLFILQLFLSVLLCSSLFSFLQALYLLFLL